MDSFGRHMVPPAGLGTRDGRVSPILMDDPDRARPKRIGRMALIDAADDPGRARAGPPHRDPARRPAPGEAPETLTRTDI